MIYWCIYLAGVALALALIARLRQMKLEEDGPDVEPLPSWFYPGVFIAAAAWPILLGVVLVVMIMDPVI